MNNHIPCPYCREQKFHESSARVAVLECWRWNTVLFSIDQLQIGIRSSLPAGRLLWTRVLNRSRKHTPGPRIHNISIHGFPTIRGYQHGYPWFLDVTLQLSIQVWISALISKLGYPYKDILRWISVNNKNSWMDIRVFMDIRLQLSILLWIHPFGNPWISVDIRALTCYGFSIQETHGRHVETRFPDRNTLGLSWRLH